MWKRLVPKPWSTPAPPQKPYSPASGLTQALVVLSCDCWYRLGLGFSTRIDRKWGKLRFLIVTTTSFPFSTPPPCSSTLMRLYNEAMKSHLHTHTHTHRPWLLLRVSHLGCWWTRVRTGNLPPSSVHLIEEDRRCGRVFQGLPSTEANFIHHRFWRSVFFTCGRKKDKAFGHVTPFAYLELTP